VTPRRDRFADYQGVANVVRPLAKRHDTLTWIAPDTSNRFQAEHHKMFLDWCQHLLRTDP
jgi:hypothetical protein